MTTEIAVIGGSGFVGRAVMDRLRARGVLPRAVRAPRLRSSSESAPTAWTSWPEVVADLAEELRGCDVVINCAGDPDASSRDLETLFGANAALPGIAAAAARAAGAHRFVHVSSAVVQGAAPRLDDSDNVSGFSAYARSKIYGERAVSCADAPASTTIYRPPSVHSPERRVTRSVHRLARSPLASVMGSGHAPTPQAHIQNVGDAIAELATTDQALPRVVIHPWEGWTTGELMRVFGEGHEPLHIPQRAARPVRHLLHAAGRVPRLAANARRVEMMWFGQEQAASWLTSQGWTPVVDREGWVRMIAEMSDAPQESTEGEQTA